MEVNNKNDFLKKIADLENRVTELQNRNADLLSEQESFCQNEKYLRLTINQAPIGIVTVHEDGRFRSVNKAFCDMLGFTAHELNEMNVKDVTHPDDMAYSMSMMSKMWNNELPEFITEKRYIGKDGSVIHGNIHVTMVKDQSGNPIFTVGQLENTTHSKSIELNLKESKRELCLKNRVNETFLLVEDLDLLLSKIMDILREEFDSEFGFFGYIDSNGDLACPTLTRDIWDKCKMPDKTVIFQKEQWGGIWGKSLKTKKSILQNGSLKLPQGHIQLKRALVVPILSMGEIIGQIALADKTVDYGQSDLQHLERIAAYIAPILKVRIESARIGEKRKEAEQVLKYHADLIGTISDAIISTDNDLNIVSWNKAAEKTYKYTEEEAQGKDYSALTGLSLDDLSIKHVLDELLRFGTWKGEISQEDKSGNELIVYSNMTVINDHLGTKTGFVIVNSNITEQKKSEEALKKSEDRFKLVIKATNDAIWDWNVKTGDVYFSPRWYTMLEYDPYELPQSFDTWETLVHPDDIAAAKKEVMEHLQPGKGLFQIEFRMKTKSGAWKWIQGRGQVTEWDSDNTAVRINGTHVDITERMKAETALRDSEQRFRDISMSMADWIWEVDRNGRYTFVSGSVEDVLGYKPDEMIGKTPFDLMDEKEAEKIRIIFEDIFDRKIPIKDLENWNISKNGSKVCFQTSGFPVFDEYGNILGYRGVDKDITERKKDEERIREQNEFLRNIMDSLSYPFYVIDIDDKKISIANRTANENGVIVGEHCYKAFHNFDVECSKMGQRCYINEIIESKKPLIEEEVRKDNDGNEISVEVHSYPVFNNDGEVIRLIQYMVDITARKNIEIELRERVKELNGLYGLGQLTEIYSDTRELFDTFVREIVPESMQFPQNAVIELNIDKTVFRNRKDTMVRSISAPIFIKGVERGDLKIGYNEDLPLIEEFEPKLVNGYAERIGKIIEHREAEEALKKAHNELESRVEQRTNELAQAVTDLKAERDRAQQYLDVAGVMIIAINTDGIVTLINRKGRELLEYDENEIIGKNWFENFLPERIKREVLPVSEKLLTGELKTAEYYENPVLTKNGKEKMIAWHNTVLRDKAGKIIGHLSSGEDITAKKKAEANLKNALEIARSAEEIAKVGSWKWDFGIDKIIGSENYFKVLGIDEHKFEGNREDLLKIIHPEDIDYFNQNIKEMLDEKITRILNYRIITPGGETKEIEAKGKVQFDEENNIIEMNGLIQDVTERNEAERKRSEAVQTAEAAMRLASIGALAGGITHEINQPLNALTIAINGLLYWEEKIGNVSNEEVFDKLAFMSKQASRIDDIIKQMRILAKQEKKDKPEEVQFNTVVCNALSLVQQRMHSNQIEIKTELTENIPVILGNSTQIEQLMLNLILNSMKALLETDADDRQILIKTACNESNCLVEVIDSGPGIPEDHIEKIFNPFFTSSSENDGMGFGLSISQKIVNEHNGHISVENRDVGGVRFYITIPFQGVNI